MNYDSLHLDSDEHVILEVRKHWIVFVENTLGLFCGAIFPFAVFVASKMFIPALSQISWPEKMPAVFLFFYSLWLLFLWINFFISWTKYFLDVWYVTEKRIIDVEQKRIFQREISNIRFDKVQDVSIEINGFIPTLLHFGTVRVQTAGETSEFVMSMVREPDRVRKVIFAQHNVIGNIGLQTPYAENSTEDFTK